MGVNNDQIDLTKLMNEKCSEYRELGRTDGLTYSKSASKLNGLIEGEIRGAIKILIGLVKDGILSVEDAAARANIPESIIRWKLEESESNQRCIYDIECDTLQEEFIGSVIDGFYNDYAEAFAVMYEHGNSRAFSEICANAYAKGLADALIASVTNGSLSISAASDIAGITESQFKELLEKGAELITEYSHIKVIVKRDLEGYLVSFQDLPNCIIYNDELEIALSNVWHARRILAKSRRNYGFRA